MCECLCLAFLSLSLLVKYKKEQPKNISIVSWNFDMIYRFYSTTKKSFREEKRNQNSEEINM